MEKTKMYQYNVLDEDEGGMVWWISRETENEDEEEDYDTILCRWGLYVDMFCYVDINSTMKCVCKRVGERLRPSLFAFGAIRGFFSLSKKRSHHVIVISRCRTTSVKRTPLLPRPEELGSLRKLTQIWVCQAALIRELFWEKNVFSIFFTRHIFYLKIKIQTRPKYVRIPDPAPSVKKDMSHIVGDGDDREIFQLKQNPHLKEEAHEGDLICGKDRSSYDERENRSSQTFKKKFPNSNRNLPSPKLDISWLFERSEFIVLVLYFVQSKKISVKGQRWAVSLGYRTCSQTDHYCTYLFWDISVVLFSFHELNWEGKVRVPFLKNW